MARSRVLTDPVLCQQPLLATTVAFLAGCSDPTESPDWQAALDYADSEIHAIAIGKQGYPFIEIQVNGRAVEVLLDTGNMTGLFLAGDVIRRRCGRSMW